MAAPEQRTVPNVLVQTAKTLPPDDSGWSTQRYVRAVSGSEGSGQIIGEWTLVQDFGIVKVQGATEFASIGVAPDISRQALVDDLVGLVVRLLVSDDDGLIQLGGGTYTAFWWGVIQTQSLEPDLADSVNTGGRASWLAVGLASVLDAIYLTRGWVRSDSGSVVDPGYLPPFNHQGGGDRSGSTVSVNGTSVYVHQLADPTTASVWTAATVLALLMAGASRPALAGSSTVYGWAWTITDADGCLAYEVEDLDLSGLSLLQAINLLASTKRGIVWTLSVSGATAAITARSASPDAIAVSGYTLPASTYTATLDAAGNVWLDGLTIDQDESSTYDVIEIRGNQPLTGLTLEYPTHLQKGWDSGSEAAWARFPMLPLYDSIWRRFLLLDAWDETGTGGDGLHNTVTTGSSDEFGFNGLTGQRAQTVAADRITGLVHEGEGSIPCGELFSAAAIGPRQAPVVVYYNGSSVYEDFSLAWRVEVLSEPFSVFIDDGQNGTLLATLMGVPGSLLYVSLGMCEHRPFAVSWQRDPSEFPRATPRVKLIKVSGCDLWTVRAGTVTGVNATDRVRGAVGASLTVSGTINTRDNSTRLSALLAVAKAWFTVPSYRVRWTDRGTLDIATTYAPGRLLNSVTLGDRTYGTYSLITRRSWRQVMRDGVEMWDTAYETQRVLPDLEVIL